MVRLSSRRDVVFITVAGGEADLTIPRFRLSVLPRLLLRLAPRGDNRIAGDAFIISGIEGALSSI